MTERDDEGRVVLADPDSLLGMLQRGRGKGYLMALERPPQEVWPLLLECITNDPRMDRLFERRYYGSLILRTGMDLKLLQPLVEEGDTRRDNACWRVDMVLSTLESLARQGSSQAVEMLRDYLRYGIEWVWATQVLGELDSPGAMEGIDEILFHRISNDPGLYRQLQDQIEEAWAGYCRADEETRRRWPFLLPMCEPWKRLCSKNDGFARFFLRVGEPCDPPRAVPKMSDVDVADLSVEELLSWVNGTSLSACRQVLVRKVSLEDETRLLESLSSDNTYQVLLALCGLGKLGTLTAFEAVKSCIVAGEGINGMVRGAACRALGAMPSSRTLGTARQWFTRTEWHFQLAGGCILEHHATLADVPLLIEALRTPETIQGKDFRLSSTIRALARFKGFGRIPEVERVFCGADDGFDRGLAAETMASTAPDHFTHEFAFECLWDCEWCACKVGCAMVDLSTPGAIGRLKEIVSDPSEEDDIRRIAENRLDGVVG